MEMEMCSKVLAYREAIEGMSQEFLANAVGVSQKTISNIENSSHIPNVLVAMRLAKTLGADIYELFIDVAWVKEK